MTGVQRRSGERRQIQRRPERGGGTMPYALRRSQTAVRCACSANALYSSASIQPITFDSGESASPDQKL